MSKQVKHLVLSLAVIGIVGILACYYSASSAGIQVSSQAATQAALYAALTCTITIVCSYTVFFVFTRRRYRDIARLSDYLRRMANGEFNLELRDNDEGELSILKNNIFALSSRLTEQTGQLSRNQSFLQSAVADISHQLKTPLTSLSMMTELLGEEGLAPEKRREFLQNLRTGLSRIEWLVLSLLKMARLESGTVELKKEVVPVSRLIAGALEPLAIMLELRGQQILIPENNPPSFICDFEWTREALTNVLKNASEHSPDGGVIALGWGENPLCCWVSVTDSGQGIAAKDLPNIFKRFYGHNRRGGLGLGLALSLAIMRGQTGDVEASSPVGQGASFTLKLFK